MVNGGKRVLHLFYARVQMEYSGHFLPSYNGGYEYSDNGVIKKVTRKMKIILKKNVIVFINQCHLSL